MSRYLKRSFVGVAVLLLGMAGAIWAQEAEAAKVGAPQDASLDTLDPFNVPLGENAMPEKDTDVEGVVGVKPSELEVVPQPEGSPSGPSESTEEPEGVVYDARLPGLEISALERLEREASLSSGRWNPLVLHYRYLGRTAYRNQIRPTALVSQALGMPVGLVVPPLTAAELGLRLHVIPVRLPVLTLTPSVAPLRQHVFPGAQEGFSD